jgi:outer membrane lipoprotein carrier protein
MINIISLLLLFTFSLTLDDGGDKLLKNLQYKFDNVKDLSTDFKQSTNNRAVISGKLLFKKEDKYRIEFKNSTLVSDGATNWSYNQKEQKVIISTNEKGNNSPFSLRKVVYEYPKECTITSELDDDTEILVLTPNKESTIGYSFIKIWMSRENLINRITLKDKADNLIQIEFSNYKLNRNIADNKFNFTPPEGSKVIDLR